MEDGGDDASGAVGGGGDDASAGGVFLVDGEGVEVDPVEDGEGVDKGFFGLLDELLVEVVGASWDLEAAREDAVGLGSVGDAGLHGLPNLLEGGDGFVLGAEGVFVGEGDFCDGKSGVLGVLEELFGGVEGVGEGDGVGAGGLEFGFAGDETAACGVEDLFGEEFVFLIEGLELHAVGVERQGACVLEIEMSFGVEGDGVLLEEGELLGGLELLEEVFALFGGEGFWGEASEAVEGGEVGGVAASSGGE